MVVIMTIMTTMITEITEIMPPGLPLRTSEPELSVKELEMLPPASLLWPQLLPDPTARDVLTRSR